MTTTTRQWWRSLFSTFISTGAGALASFVGSSFLVPAWRAVEIGIASAVVSAATDVLRLLKANPLPPEVVNMVIERLPRPSVLLVDDDQEFARLLVAWVPECDFVLASTCAQAHAIVASSIHFDSLVLDVYLPDCNGLSDLFPAIREKESSQNARCLFVTGGDVDARMVNNAMAVGKVSFLIKDGTSVFLKEIRSFLLAGRPKIQPPTPK